MAKFRRLSIAINFAVVSLNGVSIVAVAFETGACAIMSYFILISGAKDYAVTVETAIIFPHMCAYCPSASSNSSLLISSLHA